MGAPWDILGVGTAAVDDVLTVERYPDVDEKAAVVRTDRHYGGLVATALVTASRLGARCGYRGVLTDDETARALREAMKREGVDVSHAPGRPDGCTIRSVIVVERSRSTRTIFYTAPRDYPSGALDLEGLAASSRFLLVDQLGLEAARAARSRGVGVVADLEWPDWNGRDEFLGQVDHLIISRAAAGRITGESDPEAMVRRLARSHTRVCTAVSLGEEGLCYALADGDVIGRIAAPRVRVVDTNGCGDVLHGAYTAALARGQNVESSLRYGVAAAGLYASRPGGWEHLPRREEIASEDP